MTIGEFLQMLKPLPKDWKITVDGHEITGLIMKKNYLSINYILKNTNYEFTQSLEKE